MFLSLLVPGSDREQQAMQRARQTLAKMTLEEKVSLCHGNSTETINAIPRVGIADEFCMSDGPHTVRPDLKRDSFQQVGGTHDYSTSLPALSALAATWDVTLAGEFGSVLGREARDRGKDMMLGPGVNLMRTPVCGRNWEYMGEDPLLTARICVPVIQGIQAQDVAACVKHFALNNQELGRFGVNVEVDERTLREIYLPAFEAAVKEGGVLAVMNAYNRFRGEHCSHSDYLNNQILKGEWGFRGLVVSDWGSLHDTVKGALGGTDVEMNAGDSIRYFTAPLLAAVKDGTVPEAVVDDKALRVLYVMAMLGKLNDGQGGTHQRAPGARNTPEHQATARKVAESAIVLLKNSGDVLPLEAGRLKNVLVLGKNAVNKHCTGGYSAEGKPPYEVTPLEGLRKRLGDGVEVAWLPLSSGDKGRSFAAIPESVLNTFDTTVRDTGVAVKAWRAEYFSNPRLQGPPAYEGFDREMDFDWGTQAPKPGVGSDSFSARWTAKIIAPDTGTYTLRVRCDDGARVRVDGQTIVDEWKAGAARTVSGEVTLEAGREYEVQAEYMEDGGDAVFSLQWELPLNRGEEFVRVKERAAKADAVILFTGTEHGHGRAMECENGDRPDLKNPAGHDEAIAELLSCNPATVVVNLSGSPVEMPWIAQAPTVVQYWYAGQEGGNALARVLCGDVNPSGRLPFTFPKQLADSPAHALGNYNGQSVTYAEGLLIGYRWFDTKGIEPLFPFGHGLSYTSFRYGNLRLSQADLNPGESVQVSVDVANTGKRAGEEVVQVYVRDPRPQVIKAKQELKAFARVGLAAGETKTVTLEITPRDLAYYDAENRQWKADAGEYQIAVGASSRDVRQTALIRLKDTFTQPTPARR